MLGCCGCWNAVVCSSRRGLAAGMLSRWQAAPSWALLAKSGSTDASASLQRISFLGTWLCCCMSDQLQNLPLGQQTLPAPFRTARVPCRVFLSWGQPRGAEGMGGRSSVPWHWVSLMARWHLSSLHQPHRSEV